METPFGCRKGGAQRVVCQSSVASFGASPRVIPLVVELALAVVLWVVVAAALERGDASSDLGLEGRVEGLVAVAGLSAGGACVRFEFKKRFVISVEKVPDSDVSFQRTREHVSCSFPTEHSQ